MIEGNYIEKEILDIAIKRVYNYHQWQSKGEKADPRSFDPHASAFSPL
jgi:hypothetical protein